MTPVLRHPATLAALAVSTALVSLLSWRYLASNGDRSWGDLLFVLSQNAVMLSSAAYSVATLAAMVTRHPRTPLLASLCLLTSSLFVVMGTSLWLTLMGSREFRASPRLSLSEALLAESALRQVQSATIPRTVLVPHTTSLVLVAPEKILDIRQQRRAPGGPPVVDVRPDSHAKLNLEVGVKLTLGTSVAEEMLDRYPPDWFISEISGRGWLPLPPSQPRPRRHRPAR